MYSKKFIPCLLGKQLDATNGTAAVNVKYFTLKCKLVLVDAKLVTCCVQVVPENKSEGKQDCDSDTLKEFYENLRHEESTPH